MVFVHTNRHVAYAPNVAAVIDDTHIGDGNHVGPPAVYAAPVSFVQRIQRRTIVPVNGFYVNTSPQPQQPQASNGNEKGCCSSCVVAMFIILLLFLVGLFMLILFLWGIHRESEKDFSGTSTLGSCHRQDLLGNGLCEEELMRDPRCFYDESDCKLNEEKERIASVICNARQSQPGIDCARHPYCEPCGKLDQSWKYLIDELTIEAGKWLQAKSSTSASSKANLFKSTTYTTSPAAQVSLGPASVSEMSTTRMSSRFVAKVV